MKRLSWLILLLFGWISAFSQTTYYSRANGNWNSAATWSTEGLGGAEASSTPTATDFVVIGNGNTVTLTAASSCASLTIGEGTTFTVPGFNFTVNGTTTINGTITFNSTTGVKTFVGLVTVNGTWNSAVYESYVFRGGITNNGTFKAMTGTYTFDTNSQSLTGTLAIPRVTVTGATVVLTNNNTLTVASALSGTGRLTQGTNAVLNLGGTFAITNMTATASGNTVNYTGAAAQILKPINYHHLGLSGSGEKTLQASTTIGGSVTIGSGTTFTAGIFTHNVGGNWTNNGTFTHSGGTINFNGTTQSISGSSTIFNNVSLSGSGTKIMSVSTTMAGSLSIKSGVVLSLEGITHQANTLVLNGILQAANGTWGGTGSGATNINSTYFSDSGGTITVAAGGSTYYSRADGDWNSATTWSTIGLGGVAASSPPSSVDFVIIGGGNTVTVTAEASCANIRFDAGTDVTSILVINSGIAVTVSGTVTIPQTVTSGANIINVGSGSLIASDIAFTSSESGAGHQITISTGTVSVSDNITGIGPSSNITFTGSGLLQIGGSFFSSTNGTLVASTSTVEYNGSIAQQVEGGHAYNHLILSGAGAKNQGTTLTVGGNLMIGNGTTFTVPGFNFTVNGTTTINGTITFNSTAGVKIFVGLVTVNGTWNSAVYESYVFRGGITNNGAFKANTGTYTFNTNSQSLTGTLEIPRVTVTGIAVILTNNNTLTVASALSGTGRLTQGTNAVLNLGGTSAITSMTATAIGNTVNFTGSTLQTINAVNYHHLGLSGGGEKTLQVGTAYLRGLLTVSSGTTFDADGALDNAVFTLLSTGDNAGSDGSIAELPSGASVTGNVTVQRFWSALDDVYRYISSPVENSPISQLQDSGIPVTGGFDGTSFPCTGCDNDYINLGWFDETVPGYIWEGYQIMPADGNDNSELLVPGRGYELYMWNGVSSSLWSARGIVNQGSYPLEVSRTITPPNPPNDYTTEDGWNMVGNPYPSSIIWNDNTDLPGGWSMTDIDPIVWVWDVAAGGWKFFDASDNSGDLPDGKIATGQAFWVYASGPSPSLTVHEAAKTPVSGAYYRQRENTPMLTITMAGSGSIRDNAYLTFDETTYTNVLKFSRGHEAISLALLSEGKRLARLSMASLPEEIPVSMVFKNGGEYKLYFTSEGETSAQDSYYLVDRYLNKVTSLRNTYSFTVTKNPQTFENRFYLSRNPEQSFTSKEVVAISAYPNPTTSNLTVEVRIPGIQNISLANNVGQIVLNNQVTYSDGIGSSQLDMSTLPKGLYYVKVLSADRKLYFQKVIKQ